MAHADDACIEYENYLKFRIYVVGFYSVFPRDKKTTFDNVGPNEFQYRSKL